MKGPNKHELSMQEVLTMDLEESVRRRCIDEAKSPFQAFHLEKTSASQGFDRLKTQERFFPQNNQRDHSQQRVSSFVIHDKNDGLPNSREELRKDSQISGGRSRSRSRKPIFSDKSKDSNVSTFWPDLWHALGDLIKGKKNGQKQQNQSLPNSHVRFQQPLEPLSLPKYSPMPNIPSRTELQRSLVFQNSQLQPYEQQFIQLLLKLLPKLHLKSTLANKLCADRAQIHQALLQRLDQSRKIRLMGDLFQQQGLNRIDKRLGAQNLNQMVCLITESSPKPLSRQQQKHIIQTTQRIISLLTQVERDVQNYLRYGSRIQELECIHEKICHGYQKNRRFAQALESYLVSCGILCIDRDLYPLEYFWKNMKVRPYSKKQFVEEFVRNDYLSNLDQKESMTQEFKRLGFQPNM